MPKSGNAHTARLACLRRLTIDGYRLTDVWADTSPELWTWCCRASLVALLMLFSITVSCAHPVPVPPIIIPPPVVVLVVPVGPLAHDIGDWKDVDTVCVPTPPVQAVYRDRQCLSMATIRSLILTARWAE
jgi:hypothetical protein